MDGGSLEGGATGGSGTGGSGGSGGTGGSSGTVGDAAMSDADAAMMVDDAGLSDAPIIVSSLPDDGAVGVILNVAVELRFSQAMDTASTLAAVSWTTEAGAAVSFTSAWSEGDTVLTLTPAGSLEANAGYRVQADTSAAGQNGRPLAAGYSFDFETGNATRTGASSNWDELVWGLDDWG